MKITRDELERKIISYLIGTGLNEKDAQTLTELVIEQEIIGNQFSPIGELKGKHTRLTESATADKEEVVVDKPSVKLIKGNGRMAALITADYLDELVSSAKRQGIYAFGIYDSTYNEFFQVYCRRIASQDCISIVVENGGPQGVVPYGGKKDVMGTNPIAYGIPTNTYPIVFDAATAKYAWGRIKQAKDRGEKLPEDAYLDEDGNLTTDPNVANAILPFGGYKGYAINLLIDVLSGSLVRGKSGLDQPLDSQRHIGTFIIIIDPAAFGDLEEFKNSTTKLATDILAVPPQDPYSPVRVPGFKGAEHYEQSTKEGLVEIDDEEWEKFNSKSDTKD